jgi:hypothetical protein
MCFSAIFSSNSIGADVHGGYASGSLAVYRRFIVSPVGGIGRYGSLGWIYWTHAGKNVCQHICVPKQGMPVVSRPRICRSGGVRGTPGGNWYIPTCGLIFLCQGRACPAAIRMFSGTISVPPFYLAMLWGVEDSAIIKQRSQRARSHCTSRGSRSGYQQNWDWSAMLASYPIQHTNWNRRDNSVPFLDPPFVVGSRNST